MRVFGLFSTNSLEGGLRLFYLFSISVLVVGCGPKILAPRTPPPKVEPLIPFPSEEPVKGMGRMYFDTVDGPAFVGKVTATREIQTHVPKWNYTWTAGPTPFSYLFTQVRAPSMVRSAPFNLSAKLRAL